ncbi:hypothetical protein BC829DRAFT_412780 [Chytridium lagenaria]|nr:hypothetical protein BC829DRAFT_412780 [Chytridium lagenaria]
MTLFPDISREYLRRLLKEYGDKNGALDLISNRLLDEKYPREEKTLVGPSAPPKNLEKKGLADNVRNTWLPDLWSPNRSSNQGSNTINAGPSIGNSSEPAEITPQTTERLKEQLAMGVSAVKESRESTVKGSIPFEPKPPPASYTSSACRVIAENDLILRGTVDELPLYLDRTAGEEGEAVLANTEGLQKFAIVLKALAHGQDDDAETYYFWFMTLCHELAHNFVSEHNSDHEYYFSSFAENYLKDLHLEMKKRGLA